MSVPVRLVERGEGRIISLDCVEHHITVRRNVTTKQVPILGQRVALDANSVAASIKLICILRDDDCSAADLVAQNASAYIDFSSNLHYTFALMLIMFRNQNSCDSGPVSLELAICTSQNQINQTMTDQPET